ncbi:origin recognition complex subunit 3 [Lampetra fluviatilis]
MTSTTSVSKGCFVFKPSGKKKKSNDEVCFQNENGEVTRESRLRFNTYQTLSQELKTSAEAVHVEMNAQVFEKMTSFLSGARGVASDNLQSWAERQRSNEIPTAAFVTGVNVADHEVVFQTLTERLRESVTPHIVSLQPKECTGLKQAVQKILGTLLGRQTSCEDDEGESDDLGDRKPLSAWRVLPSFSALCSWYSSLPQPVSDGVKGKRKVSERHSTTPPIVIILRELESFPPRVLQDLIRICSQYVDRLPLVLVLGIATSPLALHRLLPHSVSSLLCVERFQTPPATELLSSTLDQLLLTDRFLFKLSGKALQVLIGIFLYHDFSVRNFVKGLQFAMMEHFYEQPLSMLCVPPSSLKAHVASLGPELCEAVRQAPSFCRYMEGRKAKEQDRLLTDNEYLKDRVCILLSELHRYHRRFFLMLRGLHTFTHQLPGHPLGKQVRELYCSVLESPVWESEGYSSAMHLLRMLARDELCCLLESCVEQLSTAPTDPELQGAVTSLQDVLQGLHALGEPGGVPNVEEMALPVQKVPVLGKTDLHQLQKTLMEMQAAKKQQKKSSPYEVLRTKAVDLLDDLVRKYLQPPEGQTLHEVSYFSDSSTLKQHLNASPRAAIQMALTNPYYYLQNKALRSAEGSITNMAPDICIAYKLHLECGCMINLYDWLQAFQTVLQAGNDSEETETPHVIDQQIHARFIRAVSELQFLGFVKPTKRKTDHVARLTWGGC